MGLPTCSTPTVLQNKLAGTVWTDIDDSKVFKILDLEDLERTFSAYQRQQVTAGLRHTRRSGQSIAVTRLCGFARGLKTHLLSLFHTSAAFARSTRSAFPSHGMPVPLRGSGRSRLGAPALAIAHTPSHGCREDGLPKKPHPKKKKKRSRERMKIAPRCGHSWVIFLDRS